MGRGFIQPASSSDLFLLAVVILLALLVPVVALLAAVKLTEAALERLGGWIGGPKNARSAD
jgi:hypothetical protein